MKSNPERLHTIQAHAHESLQPFQIPSGPVISRLCWALATGVALLFGSGLIHAATSVSAQATGSLGSETQTAATGSVSAAAGGSNSDAAELSRAAASFGLLGTFAEGHMVFRGPNNQSSVFATGTASFADDITIDAPGRTGQSGFFTFKIHIDGNLSAQLRSSGTEPSPQSYAQAKFQVFQNGGFVSDNFKRLRADGTTVITGEEFLNQEKTIVVPITFGTVFEVKVLIQAGTNSRSEFGADCIGEMENTAAWNGIASVTDGSGMPVQGYTVASGSGADYTQPITAPEAVSAVSRKMHGAVPFDVNLPPTGNPGIECRAGGASGDHQVIISFANPVSLSGASVASGTGSVASSSVSGADVTVNLTGILNAQRLIIRLSGVNDGATQGNAFVAMNVLAGDSNGDGLVNAGDSLQTRNRSGQVTDATNFRSDVNADGTLNSGDTTVVRARSGTSLP